MHSYTLLGGVKKKIYIYIFFFTSFPPSPLPTSHSPPLYPLQCKIVGEGGRLEGGRNPKVGCGVIVKPSGDRDRYSTSVSNINDLSTIVIPFFQQHRLYGAKWLDFQYFSSFDPPACSVAGFTPLRVMPVCRTSFLMKRS